VTRAPGDWVARLRLDPTVFVAPGAVVVGEVTMGAGTSVWFNAVVRGDTAPVTVGAGTNLQDGAVVHVDQGQPALIGDRVTVGHGAVVHGCEVGDECLVGMGAIVLSGARLGAGSLVGAGALVREGQVVPAGSLVLGMPGKVVGVVTEVQRAGLRTGAAHYRALAQSYLERGFGRPHPWPGTETHAGGRHLGPLGFMEWGQRLAVLSEGPRWVASRLDRHAGARWRVAPGEGRWSALEVLCHLRDVERVILAPRLERLLGETHPAFEDIDITPWAVERAYAAEDPRAAHQAWSEARLAVLTRLAPLGPAEWRRFGYHSVRGPYAVGEMVRHWADHDLSHRRQIAVALGELA